MNTNIIRRLRRDVNLTPAQARILESARREVVKAGDAVRQLAAWKDDFLRRKQRAA